MSVAFHSALTAANVNASFVSKLNPQTVAGLKTFLDGIAGDLTTDSTTTGADQTLGAIKMFLRVSNASLTSIAGIAAPSAAMMVAVTNKTGASVTVRNDSVATAANRIVTGTGLDLTVANGATIILYYDTVSSRWNVIGGTGGGTGGGTASSSGINYISNTGAEANTTGFATYADAAGAIPVDGTGGSPSVTFTRSTSSPLRGFASFLYTKDAVNRQGQGVSYDFTIDTSDKYSVLRGSFEYYVASGTFVDDTLEVFVIDLTFGTIIYCSPSKLKNSLLVEKFSFDFQTTNSSTYRLVIHNAGTSASAFTMMFDNFALGPNPKAYGGTVTDWKDFPSNAAGTLIKAVTTNPTFGTVSVNKAVYRYVADSIEIKWDFYQTTAGTAGSGVYLFDFSQLGISADTSKITPDTSGRTAAVGLAHGYAANIGPVFLYSSTQLSIAFESSVGGSFTVWNSAYSTFSTAGAYWTMYAKIPILGKGSSQILSSDADTRVLSALIGGTPANASATNPIIFPTINKDTHGCYNATTGTYTVAVAGDYQIFTGVHCSVAASALLQVYKNGSLYQSIGQMYVANTFMSGECMITCAVGDLITIRSDSSLSSFTSGRCYFHINKISGPSQVMASESVSCSYYCSTNKSPAANGQIDFDTKEWDSHNAVTTGSSWAFTAPISGVYQIDGRLDQGTSMYCSVYVAGSKIKNVCYTASEKCFSVRVRALAGQSIDIRAGATGTGFTGGALSSDATTHVSISRVGNY